MNREINTFTAFGDWHENEGYALKALHTMAVEIQTPDVYLHVGDFGIFRPNQINFCKSVDDALVKQDREMWVTDGNHENHEYISMLPFDDRGLKVLGKNLFVLPRGYRWVWNDVRFASLGGAFSVNKHDLRKGIDWWAEETITQGDFIRAIEGEADVDILITHDSPVLPPGSNEIMPHDGLYNLTEYEIEEADQNRQFIAEMVRIRNVKLNIHGHHHFRYNNTFEDRCKVIGLDKDNGPLEKNRVTINLENFKNIDPNLNLELV